MLDKYFVAIVGCKHYLGTRVLKPGKLVCLEKDPDNDYDEEAISAYIFPEGKIGYVANSTQTVPKGCRSAGRLYDTFDDVAYGVICFVVHDTAIVEILEAGAVHWEIVVEIRDRTEV